MTHFSSATWGFTNQKNEAIFYGKSSLYNQGDPLSSEILAWASTRVQFTLTESVHYLLSTSFIGIPNGNGASARVFGEIFHDASELYAGAAQTTEPALLSLPATGAIGSASGTFTAGTYSFFLRELVYQTNGGTLTGDFALTLSEHPHSVPDGGSTLAMLGTALLGIGALIRRRATASPC